MSGFDPIISLNSHIALLTLVEDAKNEVERAKGIIRLAAKATGRIIISELVKSREAMKANKMWVQDFPIGERRYRYSLIGQQDEYEISESDLDFHRGMVMRDIEQSMIPGLSEGEA